MAKINISIDDELMKRVDSYVARNYMTRSGVFSFAVTQFLDTADVVYSMKEMALCMRKISDNNSIDEETLQHLEDIERLLKMISKRSS